MNWRMPILLIVASASILTGCSSGNDLSNEPDVQQAGLIGRSLELTRDVELFVHPYDVPKILALRPLRPGVEEHYKWGRVIGQVDQGTRLRVLKLQRITGNTKKDDWFWLQQTFEYTLAQIETGPHTGEIVALNNLRINARSAKLSEFVRE